MYGARKLTRRVGVHRPSERGTGTLGCVSCKVWVLPVGLMLLGCKAIAEPTSAATASSAPEVAGEPPTQGAPEALVRILPVLSGSLPAIPAGALRVTLRPETVEVGETEVARLKAGALVDDEAGALVRALTVAGSASRPVAIFVDASVASGAVIEVVDAARTSGASSLGFVARLNGDDLGWLPISGTTLREDGVPVIRLDAGHADFESVVEESWSKAGGAHRMSVSVDGTMDAQALFGALHLLRGPRCADEPGACRFAALGITDDPVPPAAVDRVVNLSGEGTIGLGNVGLIGKGGGGGTGSGYGRGADTGRRVPRVRQGKATVGPALDKDIIRRIVRAHINEVRHCYNQGLVRDPDLSGAVKVSFTIAATGKVKSSVVKSTTVSDPNVGACVAKAVKRWKFPKPNGGAEVKVTYPFHLSPG